MIHIPCMSNYTRLSTCRDNTPYPKSQWKWMIQMVQMSISLGPSSTLGNKNNCWFILWSWLTFSPSKTWMFAPLKSKGGVHCPSFFSIHFHLQLKIPGNFSVGRGFSGRCRGRFAWCPSVRRGTVLFQQVIQKLLELWLNYHEPILGGSNNENVWWWK